MKTIVDIVIYFLVQYPTLRYLPVKKFVRLQSRKDGVSGSSAQLPCINVQIPECLAYILPTLFYIVTYVIVLHKDKTHD